VAVDGHGTALALALRLAVGEQAASDLEVAVPTLDGDAVARAALTLGMRVVPIDVDQDNANLSARALMAALTPQTRAVVATHAFGHPATMPDLVRLAEHHGFALIEDASAALGAEYANVPAGALGHVAALGGGEGHLLTTPEVGAVLVADPEAAARVRGWRDENSGPPLEAPVRVALAQLRAAPEALHARRQAAWHLTYELRQVRGVSPMYHSRRVRHAYDRYVLRLRTVLWERTLEETAAALSAEGVPASVAVGPLLHEDQDIRARLGEDERLAPTRFNAATQLAGELLALPLNSGLTSRDMNDVADAIRKVAGASLRHDTPR
jgi:dTDP-4-amino-4,6-dideoxygalactose transaminase